MNPYLNNLLRNVCDEEEALLPAARDFFQTVTKTTIANSEGLRKELCKSGWPPVLRTQPAGVQELFKIKNKVN